jgi:hypothetical protein
LPTFAAIAHRNNLVTALSVRFLQVAQFSLRAQRRTTIRLMCQTGMSASLIGCLGQALFPLFNWAIVIHPGHASLRSLF